MSLTSETASSSRFQKDKQAHILNIHLLLRMICVIPRAGILGVNDWLQGAASTESTANGLQCSPPRAFTLAFSPLVFLVLLKHIPESPTLLSSSIKSDSDFKGIQTIFSLARVLSDNWYWNTKTRRTTITISPVTKPFFSEVYAVKLMLQIVCSSIFPTTGYARTQVCESPEETQCFPGPKQMVRLALSSVIRYLK